jgi:two-component system, chemotaxis family, sensor kinase CheA
MTERERQLRERLLVTFKEEAREHVAAMARELLAIESAASPADAARAVETAFREAHSLKGAARSVALADIESVCQAMESVFNAMKRGHLAASPEVLDELLKAVRVLERLQATPASGAAADKPAIGQLTAALQGLASGKPPAAPTATAPERPAGESLGSEKEVVSDEAASVPPHSSPLPQGGGATMAGHLVANAPRTQPAAPAVPSPRGEGQGEGEGRDRTDVSVHPTPAPSVKESASTPTTDETVRVATAKLDALFWQAEELLLSKLDSTELATDTRELRTTFERWHKQWHRLQTEAGRMQRLLDGGRESVPAAEVARLLEFLDWNRAFIEMLDNQVTGLSQFTARHQRALGQRSGQLLDDARQLLMLPCAWLFDPLRPLVRELARAQSKETDLVIEGGDLEMDRRVLAELKDPLIHILRNAVDHGLEKPEERLAAGKPRRGIVTIQISQTSGNRVEFRITDDGRGVDLEKLKAAAVKMELMREDEARLLDSPATLDLVFQSGVSTSPLITDISGRGLGMAIVREKVERLDGRITIGNQPGAGTTLRIEVPLTLSTFRAVLVRAGEQTFAIPEARVERVGRVARRDIRSVENRDTIAVNGGPLALVRLGDVLGLPRQRIEAGAQERLTFLVLQNGPVRVACVVDELRGEQEVLVKALGPQLRHVRNLAGATVLGTGRIALILDVPALLRDAVRLSESGEVAMAAPEPAAEARRKSVLVAEDSITSRTLLKNILESAGYTVTTAVDGVDAFTKLRTDEFDLVVSDVDMPRMNGFALTSKIRADRKLAELPVVLVTALDSRDDRERGIDAGANAYIVKRSFEQSNLLEAVKRLI